ncbi:hypothetical protein DP939_11690 [Spongiactinospora rosea]|uniref:Uncharacterized protein n=1 Tax=Spongiactinospora rosea TaxID=2248750 RepID=A0A366M2M0_9ACTN|nr:hypothetical protein DP939_11690 [Spongiactinospora rosea]
MLGGGSGTEVVVFGLGTELSCGFGRSSGSSASGLGAWEVRPVRVGDGRASPVRVGSAVGWVATCSAPRVGEVVDTSAVGVTVGSSGSSASSSVGSAEVVAGAAVGAGRPTDAQVAALVQGSDESPSEANSIQPPAVAATTAPAAISSRPLPRRGRSSSSARSGSS